MSKAEEIAEAKSENNKARKKLWQAYLKEDETAFIEGISEVEETHTSDTLDELKKAIKNEMYIDDADEETAVWANHVLEGVFEYIDEAKTIGENGK